MQRRARILALQALYAEEQYFAIKTVYDFAGNDASQFCFGDVLEFPWLDRIPPQEELFIAKILVQGIRQHREEIDQYIIQNLKNWTMDRLLLVDQTILRLGIYMLRYLLDTPTKVILDECIELCHIFSSERSYRLVNGVLHTLASGLR